MKKKKFIIILLLLLSQVVQVSSQIDSSSGPNIFRLVKGLDTLGLKTGDILFFKSKTFDAKMIQIGTLSPFTHSAMVVRQADGTILLTHATDNLYEGIGMPVIDEKESRGGVILTNVEDSFNSTDYAKSGYYKRIWIRKLDDSKIERPTSEEVLAVYDHYKIFPFETSKIRFILTTFDLRLFKRDLFSLPDNEPVMCSEYMTILFEELNMPFKLKQAQNEYTPANINKMINPFYGEAIVYKFKDGMYYLDK